MHVGALVPRSIMVGIPMERMAGGRDLGQLRRTLVLACSVFAVAEACLAQTPGVVAAAEGVAWAAKGTRIVLIPIRQTQTLRQQLTALPANTTFLLTFVGLQVEVDPGIAYNAYLDLPEGAATGNGAMDPHFIGALSLFDAESPVDRSLDITQYVRRRLAATAELDALNIRILPAGSPHGEALVRAKAVQLTAH